MRPELDIVVPAGPGDRAWTSLLPQLARSQANRIILVLADDDACDVPETLEKPSLRCKDDEQGFVRACLDETPANLQVCRSKAGRAIQLNAGARASDAAWLWFLHADSQVTSETLAAMQEFARMDSVAIGYFRLRFLDDGPRWMFLNTFGAAFRSRVLGLPFGDQGLLMPRSVFDAIGGFDETVAIGEDHDLIWSARSRGIPIRALAAPILTSARKYAERGWWRTTREHLGMTREQAQRFSRRHNRRKFAETP